MGNSSSFPTIQSKTEPENESQSNPIANPQHPLDTITFQSYLPMVMIGPPGTGKQAIEKVMGLTRDPLPPGVIRLAEWSSDHSQYLSPDSNKSKIDFPNFISNHFNSLKRKGLSLTTWPSYSNWQGSRYSTFCVLSAWPCAVQCTLHSFGNARFRRKMWPEWILEESSAIIWVIDPSNHSIVYNPKDRPKPNIKEYFEKNRHLLRRQNLSSEACKYRANRLIFWKAHFMRWWRH